MRSFPRSAQALQSGGPSTPADQGSAPLSGNSFTCVGPAKAAEGLFWWPPSPAGMRTRIELSFRGIVEHGLGADSLGSCPHHRRCSREPQDWACAGMPAAFFIKMWGEDRLKRAISFFKATEARAGRIKGDGRDEITFP